MAQPQKEPLRALSEQEERELKRRANATSERLDVVRRAKALLAVASGKPFTEAAHEAGLKSGDGVGKLVKRFNARSLAALSIAAGAGRKATYTSQQRARIVMEVQREPDRKANQTATWSLMTLRQALRETDLPEIAAETIREVLHEAGYRYLRTRTWVPAA
jgi:transposase